MRILLVEDDPRSVEALTGALEAAGYLVDHSADGRDAWFKGDTEPYAAVVLDLGLPGMDGLAVLKRWRAAGSVVPVLILSARGDWAERVEGIDAGADDYLPKPFQIPELLARLRAILRRAAGHANAVLQAGPLTPDTRQMQASLNAVPIRLSPQELRLLRLLMHHVGSILSQSDLAEHLYGEGIEHDTNAVEVLIGRLRRKIGADLIQTRRGFGYLIPQPDPQADPSADPDPKS